MLWPFFRRRPSTADLSGIGCGLYCNLTSRDRIVFLGNTAADTEPMILTSASPLSTAIGPETRLGVALTVAGATLFVFVRPTIHLFLRPKRHLYYTKGPPSDRQVAAYLAALLVVSSTAGVLAFAARIFIPLRENVVMDSILSVAAAVGIVGLSCVYSFQVKQFWWSLRRNIGRNKSLALVVVCVATIFLMFTTSAAWSLLRGFFLCASGTLPLVMFLVIKHLADRAELKAFAEKPAKPISTPPRLRSRVVLMIFDELDERVAFDERPLGVQLPCLDQFLSESVVCPAAYPPANCTEISLPAFMTGRLIDETFVSGPTSMGLKFSGTSIYEPFAEQVTIFHRLRERSVNCGVVMSYHPIGRLFGDIVADYLWLEGPTQESSIEGSIAEMTGAFLRSLLETPKYSLFGSTLTARVAMSHFLKSSAAAIRMASDSRIDVAFLHWTIPHAPYIYDRVRRTLGRTTMGPKGYLDNLALADLALGQVRTEMIDAGLWEKSVVIVTSDHWWRYASGLDGKMDQRVPFAVHFPMESQRTTYAEPFNTIVLHDLTLAIVDGYVRSTSDLLAWLATNAAYAAPTKL